MRVALGDMSRTKYLPSSMEPLWVSASNSLGRHYSASRRTASTSEVVAGRKNLPEASEWSFWRRPPRHAFLPRSVKAEGIQTRNADQNEDGSFDWCDAEDGVALDRSSIERRTGITTEDGHFFVEFVTNFCRGKVMGPEHEVDGEMWPGEAGVELKG